MRLIHLEKMAVQLPGRTLMDSVTWSIFRGDRCGLVGPNGAGKTTLLRILHGTAEASAGSIARTRDLSIGYLPQDGLKHRGRTLFGEAWAGLPDLPHLQREIDRLHIELNADPDNAELAEEFGALLHRWETLEGYRAEAKVNRVLSGLGFRTQDLERPVEEFSGGWQMRIALAKLLLFDPDLLLLDEPTNHLDLPALIWLEEFLRKFAGSLIIVSHDRLFLDRAVSSIAEIEHGRLTLYKGNYSDYEAAREARQEQLAVEAERTDAERKRIEGFVERFRYKASKAKQVQSRVKLLEKMTAPEQRAASRRMRFRFPPAPPSSRIVVELTGVAKSYGSFPVFRDGEFTLVRGEKVALVGVNGAGKSTLCRLLAGQEQPSAGFIKLGHNVAVEYFAQEADFHLRGERSVLEEMEAEGSPMTQTALRGLLGAFLFTGDDVYKPVKVLSGGEKSRLALAKILLHPANFIILDEPTNHLDISSQNVLLDALHHYEGTLLVVSHDRYFLDRLVDRVLEMDGGTLRDWPGNLSEYLSRRGLFANAGDESARPERGVVGVETQAGFKTKDRKRQEADIRNRHSQAIGDARRLADKLQLEVDQLERQKAELEISLADENLYRDADKCRQMLAAYERVRSELPQRLALWEQAANQLVELELRRNEDLRSETGR